MQRLARRNITNITPNAAQQRITDWPKPNFSACMAITGKIRMPTSRQLG